MIVSMLEYNIAVDLIDHCIDNGFMDFFHDGQKHYSMWDWFSQSGMFKEGYDYSDGATKGVIFHPELENWVIKFRLPCEDADKDYCKREYDNYVAAEEAGLEEYFAVTAYLCERNGVCFYLQQKVYCDDTVDCEMHSKLQDRYENSNTPYDQDSLWEELECMDGYERIMVLYENQALANFVHQYHINDLHCGNFGMLNGYYVMIDFSGFGSQIFMDESE